MKRTVLTAFYAVAAILWGGCNRPTSTLTVEELLASPQDHSHAVVKVKGCLVHGMEKLVLQPCGSQSRTQCIWVDNARDELEQTQWSRLHPQYKERPGIKLFFEYDEARNSRAWKKLDALLNKADIASDVVLVGQFETLAPQMANPKTDSGFGHLGAYTHELILVDVLGSKSDPAE